MSPVYRVFKEADIEPMLDLMRQLGYQHSKESLLGNITRLRKRDGEVFVVECESRVCGCVSAMLDVRLAAGTYGEIVSLVVDEGYRGKGLGKGLIHAAEAWLAQLTSKVRVRANAVRSEAHEFYYSLGFEEAKTQKVLVKVLKQ